MSCDLTVVERPDRTLEATPLVMREPPGAPRYKMVARAGRMLALHRKLAAASIPDDKKLYQRQIEATDRQIDALVYELYELTEEDIGVGGESANREPWEIVTV